MAENLIVETRIRELIHSSTKGEGRLSGDAVETLSKKVEGIVKEAVKRAKDNGRKTVQTQDF